MKRYAILFCLILMTLPSFSQSYVGTVINRNTGKHSIFRLDISC